MEIGYEPNSKAIGPTTKHRYKENGQDITSLHFLFALCSWTPLFYQIIWFSSFGLSMIGFNICLVGYICLVGWFHLSYVGLVECLPILIPHRFPSKGGIGAENWPIQREIGLITSWGCWLHLFHWPHLFGWLVRTRWAPAHLDPTEISKQRRNWCGKLADPKRDWGDAAYL